jgi:hypothetical protein
MPCSRARALVLIPIMGNLSSAAPGVISQDELTMPFHMPKRHPEFLEETGGLLRLVALACQLGGSCFLLKHTLPTLYDVPIGFSELLAIVEHEVAPHHNRRAPIQC